MSNAYYKLYKDDIKSLCNTLVIKSVHAAEAINNTYLTTHQYLVDMDRPKTWHYYLNLSGQYHQSDLDVGGGVPINITSLDTGTVIPFTMASLRRHPATKAAYSFGNREYDTLIEKYPTLVPLIRGMATPVDIDMAIAADDHEILYYDDEYVEEQETRLISDLQEWIHNFFLKWSVARFDKADLLYTASHLGIMWTYIPSVVEWVRLQYCKTPRVHSFHLWAHLDSHSNLGMYRHSLTLEQALYLYRNIEWLIEHAGSQLVMDKLVDVLFTKRNLPFYNYKLSHSLQDTLSTLDVAPVSLREGVNIPIAAKDVEVLDIALLITKEDANFSKYPGAATTEYIDDASNLLKTSPASRLDTKTSEVVVQGSVRTGVNELYIAINHWAWLASKGLYNAKISTANTSNGSMIKLTPLDNFYLYIYLLSKAQTHNPQVIPPIPLHYLLLDVVPTVKELSSVTDRISDAELAEYLVGYPTVGPQYSKVAFMATIAKINAYYIKNIMLFEFEADKDRFAQKCMVADGIRHSAYIHDYAGQKWSTWLAQRGLDFSRSTNDEMAKMATEIGDNCTGFFTLATGSALEELATAMTAILQTFNTYDTHILIEDHVTEVESVNDGGLRWGMGGVDYSVEMVEEVGIGPLDIEGYITSSLELTPIGTDYGRIKDSFFSTYLPIYQIDIGIGILPDLPMTTAVFTETVAIDVLSITITKTP